MNRHKLGIQREHLGNIYMTATYRRLKLSKITFETRLMILYFNSTFKWDNYLKKLENSKILKYLLCLLFQLSRSRGSYLNPFIRFLARRIGFLVITFFTFLIIIFTLPRAIPGNPLATLLSQIFQQAQANPELVKTVEKKLMEEFGIGKPIHVQFFEFCLLYTSPSPRD